MAVKGILTNREIMNKLTGIDLYVSDYQEIPHKIRNEFLYHVIVVTNQFYYKSKEHKQSDVVQFMVSKSFEEFEELYNKLYKRFPSVNFPLLPSKLSFSNKPGERLQCMEKVMKLVACTQKLASSTMVISFLKGDSNKTADVCSDEKPPTEKINAGEKECIASQFTKDHESGEKTNENPSTQEDDNLFEVDLDKTDDIIDEVENLTISTNNVKKSSLFDDDAQLNDDDLFSTPSSRIPRKSEFEKKYDFENDDDLLNVKDDLNDLLALSKSSEKQSAIKVDKPNIPSRAKSGSIGMSSSAPLDIGEDEVDGIFQRTKSLKKERSDSSTIDDIFSKNKGKGLFDDEGDDDLFAPSLSTTLKDKKDIEQMGQDDIMNYIKSSS